MNMKNDKLGFIEETVTGEVAFLKEKGDIASQVGQQIGFAVNTANLLRKPLFVASAKNFCTGVLNRTKFVRSHVECKMKFAHRHGNRSRQFSGTTTLRTQRNEEILMIL